MKPFDIISAQPKAWSIVSRSFRNDRLASTYLFTGRYGVGHFPFALALAALVNCEQVRSTPEQSARPPRPCGECRNCRAIFGLNFEGLYPLVPIPSHKSTSEMMDLTNEALDALRKNPLYASLTTAGVSLPIDMARDVQQALTRRGSSDIMRVVIFDRMETMRQASADALLKMVEEPPPQTVIIMTARRPDSLLPTLQSRAQLVRLRAVATEHIVDYLREVYELSEDSAGNLANLSEGLPGRAVEMAEELDDGDQAVRFIAQLLFRTMLNEPSVEVAHKIVEKVGFRDRELTNSILAQWQSFIRDCARIAIQGDTDGITNVDLSKELQELAGPFADSDFTASVTREIKNTLADLSLNVHIHPALIALAIRIREQVDKFYAGATPAPG